MTSYKSLTFGDAEHLPGAEALLGINGQWPAHTLLATGEGNSSSVANLPDYPDVVVRIQHTPYDADESARATIARTGIRHFEQMEAAGLYIPPQRFVDAPSIFTNDPSNYLYSFTDRIRGRELTSDPADAAYAPSAIDGLAKYLSWIHTTHEPHVLWDKVWSWQHTVLEAGGIAMHDVGLEFRDAWKGNGRRVSKDMYLSSLNLIEWAHNAGVDEPESLQRLIHAIEPLPLRLARKAVWKLTNHYGDQAATA